VSRRAKVVEARARRQEARARVAHLRERLREALAAKRERMRELTRVIRAERLALRERLKANRVRFREELRSWERSQRAGAKAQWRTRREVARKEAADELARMRAEIAAEQAHVAEIRRIARDTRDRARRYDAEQSDDAVRALIPSELAPLFERLGRSVRGGSKRSRAEVFLRLAQERPEEVFRVVEPGLERMIRDTILELGRAHRASRSPRGALRTPARAANGNGLTGGGPDPDEAERVRRLEDRPRHAEKGEGLDTAQIAKAIREEIKAAVKSGALPKAKYSVKTDRYSMGSSITVEASKLPFPTLNPDAFRVDPGANWLTFDSARFRSRFTPKAQDVERKLSAIVNAYHWDRSDSSTDYYDERFARHVNLTEDAGEWKRVEAAKVAAARAAEARE
jgi:hypothetical protein